MLDRLEKYKFIKFLQWRIKQKKYVGLTLSPHNRLSREELIILIKGLLKFAKNWIDIPPGDDPSVKKKHFNSNVYQKLVESYPEYLSLVNYVKSENWKYFKKSKGTFNSIKKNFFPYLENMEIIERTSNKRKVRINNYDIINKNYQNELFYNDRIKIYLNKDHPSLIDDIWFALDELKYITIKEFLYFFSYIGFCYNDNKIDKIQVIKFIVEYRNISKPDKVYLDNELKKIMIPNINITKEKRKDYHNWLNTTQQTFNDLDISNLLQINNDKIEFYKDYKTKKLRRNVNAKKEYFSNHKISKRNEFQIDHIIPFNWISLQEHIPLIDNWQNFIYIDSNTHSKKNASNNTHVIFKKLNYDNYLLESLNKLEYKDIKLTNNKNLLINSDYGEKIENYNKELLEKLK